MRGLLAGCAVVAALSLAVPAHAADGIRATAIASRKVPADVLVLSFHLTERANPEQPSRLPAEEQRMREEIRKTGATITAWTTRVAFLNAGYTGYSSSSKDQAVQVRREITARLTGVTDTQPIEAALVKNAVRHGAMLTWTASDADKVREELEADAAAAAVAKARSLAERTGAKAGNVIDLQILQLSPGNTTANRGEVPLAADEVLEDDKGRSLVLRASAAVTLYAKSD